MCAGVFAVQISSHFLGGLVMLKLAVIVLGFILTSPAQGDSFEKGLSGWENLSQPSKAVVIEDYADRHGTVYLPTEGEFFLFLNSAIPEPCSMVLIFSAVGFLLARRKCKVC